MVFVLRAGSHLGRTARIETSLATGVAQLYALLPAEVGEITLDCPASAPAGSILIARCTIAGGGDQVVHWTLAGVDGEALPPYALNTLTEGGAGEASFRLPLDMTGRWTLTARDVISGQEATQAIDIAAPAP